MSYRQQWVQDILGDRSVLACILDVHMTTTGAFDREDIQQFRDVIALVGVLLNWKEGRKECETFDNCVKHLIMVVIDEYKMHREKENANKNQHSDRDSST